MKRILALYPRDWRERYGDEVSDLADELVRMGETTPARARLGLVGGAAVERWRSWATATGAMPPAHKRLVPLIW